MSVIPFVLFSLAALVALLAIGAGMLRFAPAVAQLRCQLQQASDSTEIVFGTLDPRSIGQEAEAEPKAPFPLPGNNRRRARPKPVTHRLHHFRRPVRAA